MNKRLTIRSLLLRALVLLVALGLFLPSAMAASLDQARFILVAQMDGRLVGGGEFERDDGELELDFEILERVQEPLRVSIHYRDGTVLIHDGRLNDRRRLEIHGSDGWISLHQLARSHRIDLDYDREDDDLDDDIVCLVPEAARSQWWPYGEDCD